MIDSILCEHQLINNKRFDLIEIEIEISIRLKWKYGNDSLFGFSAKTFVKYITCEDGDIPVPITLQIMLDVYFHSDWP